jgi:hypothetical protein
VTVSRVAGDATVRLLPLPLPSQLQLGDFSRVGFRRGRAPANPRGRRPLSRAARCC